MREKERFALYIIGHGFLFRVLKLYIYNVVFYIRLCVFTFYAPVATGVAHTGYVNYTPHTHTHTHRRILRREERKTNWAL